MSKFNGDYHGNNFNDFADNKLTTFIG